MKSNSHHTPRVTPGSNPNLIPSLLCSSQIPHQVRNGSTSRFKWWAFTLLILLTACQAPGRNQQLLQQPVQRFNVATRQTAPPVAPTPPAATVPDFGTIPAPVDNPVTQGKVELGFRLWFEPRLSAGNRMTCATCHNHTMGFSNAQANAAGVTGARGDRNVPTIYGSVHQRESFWDGRAKTLEIQALGPIENPIEMNETIPNVLRKLEGVPYYQQKFKEVFGTTPSAEGMAKALSSFERALTMAPTPYERFQKGEKTAMTDIQQRGMNIFFSPRGRCFMCHQGQAFSNQMFVNIGVGMNKPNPDLGRFKVTNMPWDRGSFKTPTLLNISQTAPYMHDGSLSTLQDVVEHYNKGGIENEALDPRIVPLNLKDTEKAELVAFLRALSAPDNLRALGKLPGIHLRADHIEAMVAGRVLRSPE